MPPPYLDNDKLRQSVQIIRDRSTAIDDLVDAYKALDDGDVDCIADYSLEITEAAQAIEIICGRQARWTRWARVEGTPPTVKKSVRPRAKKSGPTVT